MVMALTPSAAAASFLVNASLIWRPAVLSGVFITTPANYGIRFLKI
jgi:hypothetical protein